MRTILFVLCIPQLFYAQTKYLNQVKYWDYRHTFKSDFIEIGSQNGQSIPIAYRSLEDSIREDTPLSSADLGWYLANLSTEYYIASKRMYLPVSEHEPSDNVQVLIELSKALNVIDRLDLQAEKMFGCELEQLNGFIANERRIGSTLDTSLHVKVRGMYASADQYINLIFGLSLTYQFLPEGTIVKGVDLKAQAKEQSLRLIGFLSENKWKIQLPCGTNKDDIYGVRNLRPYAPMLKDVAKTFTNKGDLKLNFLLRTSRSLSNLFRKSGKALNDDGELAMLLSVTRRERAVKRIEKLTGENRWIIYPMIYALVNQSQTNSRLDSLINQGELLLNSTPVGGIYSSNGLRQAHGWSTASYFKNSELARLSETNSTEKVKFNGLDFLLLYNIWFIHRTGI
ncbi:MAG: hypothetical protein AAF487_02200 [Bacteroidota bacterium]